MDPFVAEMAAQMQTVPRARNLRDAVVRVAFARCRVACEVGNRVNRAFLELAQLARATAEANDDDWTSHFDGLWRWYREGSLTSPFAAGHEIAGRMQVHREVLASVSYAAIGPIMQTARAEVEAFLTSDGQSPPDETTEAWAVVLRYFEDELGLAKRIGDALPAALGTASPSAAEANLALYRLERAAADQRWLDVDASAERLGLQPAVLHECVRRDLLQSQTGNRRRARYVNLGAASRLLGLPMVWSSSKLVPIHARKFGDAQIMLRRGPAPGDSSDSRAVAHFAVVTFDGPRSRQSVGDTDARLWAIGFAEKEYGTPCTPGDLRSWRFGHPKLARNYTIQVASLLSIEGGAARRELFPTYSAAPQVIVGVPIGHSSEVTATQRQETVLMSAFQEQAPSPDILFDLAVRGALASDPESRRQRLAVAPRKPTARVQIVRAFERNPDVVAEVLLRAAGICERCKRAAPFRRASDGTPYLEVHHRIRLADGGDDTVENAVALCPNCHRQQHYG